MKLKEIIDEDFINYKKPSMFLATCYCDWKCLLEKNLNEGICQNSSLVSQKNIEISNYNVIDRYRSNPISKAIIFGGLEPIKQFDEVLSFINCLRHEYQCDNDVVIYTGYYPNEIQDEINSLKQYKNIIIKFGRFEINSERKFDDVLGIWLNSSNQWAERIS